jgi:putative membrane protein
MVPMMFFVFFAFAAVIWAVTSGNRSVTHPPAPRASTAEEILAERYARGEIDTGEYRERLNELRQHATQ